MPEVRRHLQLILNEYVRARTATPFSGSNEVAGRFRDLARSLEETDAVRARATIKVGSSYGKGNWARLPGCLFLIVAKQCRRGLACTLCTCFART